MKNKILIIFFFLFASNLLSQESSEQLIIPLTDSGFPGWININHFKGNIEVTGYEGNVVIIEASERKKSTEIKTKGLKSIPSNIQLDGVEKNNNIDISTNSENLTIDLVIKVPINFSLNLTNNNQGIIAVSNVSGEMVITNINGDIVLSEVSGSALLNTVDGEIKAIFKNVNPDKPMAFSTIDGNIDVTLPSDLKADCKMSSELGKILSDFNMTADKRKTRTEKSDKNGSNKTYLDKWTYGKINGGGPEYLFKCYDGDIIIRKLPSDL